MLSPDVQASLDQIAAVVQDAYVLYGVDIHDPAQLRAIKATWLFISANQHALIWVLAGIDEALQAKGVGG